VVARTALEAAAALEAPGPEGPAAVQPPRIALLLPGQGSQHPRMGQALYEAGGVFRRELDAHARILEPLLGLSITELLYGSGAEHPGQLDRLGRTELAQPVVFAVSVALARHWQSLGIAAEGLLGHSVGEYAAAHLAGVFTLEAALALLVERGRLIAALPPGAMLAVSRPWEEARELCGSELALAAVNGPAHCVLSGPVDAIADLEARAADRSWDSHRLQTSHAFHSPMMRAAAEPLAAAVARCARSSPRERFVSNVTGTWITPHDAVDPRYWVRHLLSTVRFADGLATLRASGVDAAIECGPGQALTALAGGAQLRALPSLAHAAETPRGGSRLARTAAAVWVAGAALDWSTLHEAPRRRIALPLYPFERSPFRPAPRLAAAAPEPLVKRAVTDGWFYRPDWIPATASAAQSPCGPAVIFTDGAGTGAALAQQIRAEPSDVVLVERGARFGAAGTDRFTVRPAETADYVQLFAALPVPPVRLVHLWGLDDGDPEALDESGLYALLALARAAGRVYPGRPLRLDLVTRGAAEVTGAEQLRPEFAAAVGAARVLPGEYPELVLRAIDVEPAPAEATAAAIWRELVAGGDDAVIALRGCARWAPSVRPLALPASGRALRDGAVLWITGGFGGVGSALARDLAGEPGVRLILSGQRATEDAGRVQLVRELEDRGATVMVAAVDLADPDAVAALVRQIRARFGAVTGVIHAAGRADLAGVVQNRTRGDTERVLAPKVAGTRALERALRGQPLDFLVLCSTLGSFLPAAKFGQIAYAAANAYLDLAAAAIAGRTGWRTVTVHWDDWVHAGMTVAAHRAWKIDAPTDRDGLTPAEGAAALRRILAADHRRIAVSVRDLPELIARARSVFDPMRSGPPARTDTARTERAAAAPLAPGETATAGSLTAAFRRILNDPGIGPDDSFFERGGHSLLAMRLLAFVRETFSVGIGLADVFECATPRDLASRIEAR